MEAGEQTAPDLGSINHWNGDGALGRACLSPSVGGLSKRIKCSTLGVWELLLVLS